MTDTRMNVDCGCVIFHYLAFPEAITLSRTSHFWYDLSSRRAAYRPMTFPAFQEGFDILEYRKWRECGRQQLALTPSQLIQFSSSRVIQHGLHDLELILDTLLIHPDPSHWSQPSSMVSMETRFSDAITRYHSIQALTITIAHGLVPSETNQLNQHYVNDHQELQRIFVSRLITHLAPKLISFHILPPTESSTGFEFAHRLAATHPNLTMPNLLHAIIPVQVEENDEYEESDEDEWYVRWEIIRPFQPQSRGLLELSSIARFDSHQHEPARYWNTINMYPEKLINPPENLIFNNAHCYVALAGHSAENRSVHIQLQAIARLPVGTIKHYVSWLIPVDANYQEVDVTLLHADDIPASILTPLRRVAHSLRILNLDVDGIEDEDYKVLLARLCTAAGVVQSDQVDYTADSESPFTHVTRVHIKYQGNLTPIDISLIPRICPNIDHLELVGSFFISFDSLVPAFPYHQLRHLTTPLPPANPTNNGQYVMKIVSHFRQLESLHLILDFSESITNEDDHAFLLLLSSSNLSEVIFSFSSVGRAWLTNDTDFLNDLNVWLMQLHLIWRMIQPTHTLPLDQLSLTPITRVSDLLPLLGTFIRHPAHRLPYLRHRCQQLFEPEPSPNWIRRIATKLATLIGSHIPSWFQSYLSQKAARVNLQADELADRQRAELVDHLARRSEELLRRLAEIRRDQFPSTTASANPLQQLVIERRRHFRMVIQEQELLPDY